MAPMSMLPVTRPPAIRSVRSLSLLGPTSIITVPTTAKTIEIQTAILYFPI